MEQGDCTKYKCLKKNPSAFIIKILTITQHQVTRDDIERHKQMITEFIQMCPNGFLVRDIVNVMTLMEVLLQRIYEFCEYGDLLEGILQIYSIPPILCLSSDVLTFARDLEEYFSMLGYLLVQLKIESLQNLVACAVVKLLTRDLSHYRCYSSLRVRKKSAENSKLPAILGQLLKIADENMYPKLLKIIILLADGSDITRKELIDQDAINSLFTRIEPTWQERYPDKPPPYELDIILHYEEVSAIIWMLLKYLDKNKEYLEHVQNITTFSLWNIKYIYQIFAENQSRCVDKNNILAIVIKLLDLFPTLDFVKSGLAEVLLAHFPVHNKNLCAAITQVLKDDDYMHMQLILTCIPYYVKFVGGITVLADKNIIQELLKCPGNKQAIKVPLAQGCSMTLMTLDILAKIVPYMEDEFMESAGPNKLVHFIKIYENRENSQRILKHCIKTLYIICKSCSSDVIANSVLYNNGLIVIMDVCNTLITTTNNLEQSCLGYAFYLLNILFKHSAEKDNGVIDMVITYMKKLLNLAPNESIHDNRVITSMMDFIWEHIVKSGTYSEDFVKKNGVFLMLDIINKYPFTVQLVALGALVDLCEDSQCIPYIITWRSRGQKILPLLMKLFREENKRLKVKSGQRGVISDVKYPLMGKEQWIQTFCRCIEVNGNPVLADMFISCRPKIYALLQMLNERYQEEVEIAEEHYKSFSKVLEPEDQVIMLLAENFLALKLGEAWVELKTELDRLPAKIIPADQKMVSYLIERGLKWSTYLQKFQNGILQNAYEKGLIEEQKLYNFLQEARLSEALQALNELIYLARCSENMFRVSQKFLQNIQIDLSLLLLSEEAMPHRTYFSTILVTPVFNQLVDVESNINKTTEETAMPPVSPSVSNNDINISLPEDLLESTSELNCID